MVTQNPTQSPDLNYDGNADTLDYNLFSQLFAAGDPKGDANRDGQRNVNDFISFQGQAAAYEGWYSPKPSPDTRRIYVSSSSGSDNNSGLDVDHPKATLAAALALARNLMPDWVCLKRGDTWRTGFPNYQMTGRSATEPAVLCAYGTGPRPIIAAANGISWIAPRGGGRGHLAIMDLDFDGLEQGGSGVFLGNNWTDVHFENCRWQRFGVGLYFGPVDSGERASKLTVRRCVSAFNYFVGDTAPGSHGFLCGAVDGLTVDECFFDHNGWSGDGRALPTIFRHNTYIYNDCTGVVFRNTVTARAGSTGLGLRSGGACDDNLCLQNPVNLGIGHGSVGEARIGGPVTNNVCFDSRDIDTENARGSGLEISWTLGAQVYNNLICHQNSGTGNVRGLLLSYENLAIHMYDNIVYDWSRRGGNDDPAFYQTGTTTGEIRDNDFQQPRNGFAMAANVPMTPGVLVSNNAWTTNATGQAFLIQAGGCTSQQFTAAGGGALVTSRKSYPYPERDVSSYLDSIGAIGGIPEYCDRCRMMERGFWDARYTAPYVNDYLREGFGKTYQPVAVP